MRKRKVKPLEIKGYVKYFHELVPVTWERETKIFYHHIQRIHIINNELTVDKRLFDDKIRKDEILLESSFFVNKSRDIGS